MSTKEDESTQADSSASPSLRLKSALQFLHSKPSPHVPNPPNCSKRASVALILRFRPPTHHKLSYDPSQCARSLSFEENLTNFFAQEWVRNGDPEVLFIKRAARAGDRWTGQVAFPGGRRDTNDADDMAASVRETMEETGLDLEREWCVPIGNLPQRVITAAWGRKPLMVLCPFVFLLLRNDTPPLDLQPAEVHSAHWVPLRNLLASELRTYERADISDRAPGAKSPAVRALFRAAGGQMMFSAVKLMPSESLFCDPVQDLEGETTVGHASKATKIITSTSRLRELEPRQNLVLWGLSLGMISDFLQLVDPRATQKLWSWPTFTHWDIRFYVWLLTRRFRNQKIEEDSTVIDLEQGSSKEQISGADSTTTAISVLRNGKGLQNGLAGAHFLDPYFENMKQAILLAIATRLTGALALLAWVLRKRRRNLLNAASL